MTKLFSNLYVDSNYLDICYVLRGGDQGLEVQKGIWAGVSCSKMQVPRAYVWGFFNMGEE